MFPKIKELFRIKIHWRHLWFGESLTKMILEMKPVGYKGKLYSSEYQRQFETEHSVAEITPYLSEPEKLRLTIDGLDSVDWFKQKQKEFFEKIGVKIQPKQPKMKNTM